MRSTLTEMEGSILCLFFIEKNVIFSSFSQPKLIENTRYKLGFFIPKKQQIMLWKIKCCRLQIRDALPQCTFFRGSF